MQKWHWGKRSAAPPALSLALSFSREQPEGAPCTILHTANPMIEIQLEAAFDLNG
jgi:hypothetical protein